MYPKISDPLFQEKINKKFSKYKIPVKKRTFDQICFPKKFELQIPQKFLAEYINPDTPYKNILIYHKIGAGKTCAAIRIAEEFKSKRRIIVVLPAFLKNSFRSELRSMCADENYLSNAERMMLNDLRPGDPSYIDIINSSNDKIDKVYSIYSYNKFVKIIQTDGIKLNNTLLIIDEVQNMINETGIYYETLYKTIKSAPKDLRLVLLSATPIYDKPVEIALTLNLLLKKELPIGSNFYSEYLNTKKTPKGFVYETKNMDSFKELIKGHVSYYAGAPSYVFPKSVMHIVKCEMSPLQLRMYRSIYRTENAREDFDFIETDLKNNFYSGTRACSNFAYPDHTYYSKLTDADFKLKNLLIYSCKYHKIITHIKSVTGTIFIYSNFRKTGGIRSLSRALEMNGFKNYATNGEGTNRFAIWSGSEKMEYRDEVKNIFNLKSNVDGSKIKIILGTPAIREGVSLLRLSEIHILEASWNWSKIAQIIGRGIRYCSHKDVSIAKRLVNVYIYLAISKGRITVDEKIMDMALKKQIINRGFERALKEAAIDCELFKSANMIDANYECNI